MPCSSVSISAVLRFADSALIATTPCRGAVVATQQLPACPPPSCPSSAGVDPVSAIQESSSADDDGYFAPTGEGGRGSRRGDCCTLAQSITGVLRLGRA